MCTGEDGDKRQSKKGFGSIIHVQSCSIQDEGQRIDIHQGSYLETNRRGIANMPPGVHGNGGLESILSERSRRT